MIARADNGECDLIAKRIKNKKEHGYVYQDGKFKPDSIKKSSVSPLKLIRSKTAPITFTCTPPGSGIRMGIDRNEDGVLDADVEGHS